MSELLLEEEAYAIRGAVFEVYSEMGREFLGPVYQECLELELEDIRIYGQAMSCDEQVQAVEAWLLTPPPLRTVTKSDDPSLPETVDARRYGARRFWSSWTCGLCTSW
jgi:hypothetical protein